MNPDRVFSGSGAPLRREAAHNYVHSALEYQKEKVEARRGIRTYHNALFARAEKLHSYAHGSPRSTSTRRPLSILKIRPVDVRLNTAQTTWAIDGKGP